MVFSQTLEFRVESKCRSAIAVLVLASAPKFLSSNNQFTMLLTTTHAIEGAVQQYLGIVTAETIISANMLKASSQVYGTLLVVAAEPMNG